MSDHKSGRFQLKMWDAGQLGILPKDWIAEITAAVERHPDLCTLDGKSSTSREPAGIEPIQICVVTGEIINKELLWLYDAYAGPLRKLAQELIGKELVVAVDMKNSVNINVLSGIGNRYERHVDSNPVTGLLYASTLREDDGGALIFEHSSGSDILYPRAGLFLAFDATATTHYVTSLKKPINRVSVPMNYYLAGEKQRRPADLDTYLYKIP